MKKILLALTLVLTLGVIGCTKKSEFKNDVPVKDIGKAVENAKLIKNKAFAPDEFTIDNIEQLKNIKDKIEESYISKAAIILKLEDVIILKTNDPDAVYTALNDYKDKSIDHGSFASMENSGMGYGGQENIDSVDNSIIEKKGNYVYMIAAPKVNEIQDKILEMITN